MKVPGCCIPVLLYRCSPDETLPHLHPKHSASKTLHTNVKHQYIQRAEGFWLAARSRRGKRSSATLTEQPTKLQGKRPGTTMRSCLELVSLHSKRPPYNPASTRTASAASAMPMAAGGNTTLAGTPRCFVPSSLQCIGIGGSRENTTRSV